jgi:hypothetical protein
MGRLTVLSRVKRMSPSACDESVIASPTRKSGGLSIMTMSYRLRSSARMFASFRVATNSPGSGGSGPEART